MISCFVKDKNVVLGTCDVADIDGNQERDFLDEMTAATLEFSFDTAVVVSDRLRSECSNVHG